MFGYVLPRKDRLSGEDEGRYRAAYCGLCRCLKLNYGFRSRFLVNYDMTFLYFLLQTEQPDFQRCACPARPFCKKNCLPADDVMEYVADLTVLLSCWKLEDARQDGGFFQRLAAKSGLWFYRRAYRRAAARQPEANERFRTQLERLHSLEAANCASIDCVADSFARLLQGCAAFRKTDELRRITELLLYHTGRYLYLVDALEDLPRDNQRGCYNPLRYRYHLSNGALTAEDKAAFLETVEASISMAASALELMPQDGNSEIRKNIIYYGLPSVLHSVAAGTFRKRGTPDERPL